ncbi:MAG: response regulator [Planctomycetales bacterium]|nr:response regulator [Planctomycetales bacterium]
MKAPDPTFVGRPSERLFSPWIAGTAVGGMLFVTAALCIWIAWSAGYYAFKGEFRENLVSLAQVAASEVDAELHKQITSPEQQESPEFHKVAYPLKRMLTSVDSLRYIYTAIERDGQVYFVVDSCEPGDHDGDGRDDQAKIMELYEDADEVMVGCFSTQSAAATPNPYTDEWGSFVTGYAPFHDDDGNFVGLVGVDVTADEYNRHLASMERAAFTALIPAMLISILVGFVVGVTERVRYRDRAARGRTELELVARSEELQRVNEDLRRSETSAQSANRAKSEFLANMSHEIRTPMTAIIGFAEMLQDRAFDESSEKRDEAISTIVNNGRHLLALINDILDLSKIEAGKMTLEWIALNPAHEIKGVFTALAGRAESQRLNYQLEFANRLPKSMMFDVVRVRQILVNLIGNAIKFTPQGQVTVTASFDIESEESAWFRVRVKDSGIGMSDEQLKTLFKPFHQADTSMTRRYGGTGLGLSISQRLAQLLGGQIVAHSQPGEGSTFVFEMKVDPSAVSFDADASSISALDSMEMQRLWEQASQLNELLPPEPASPIAAANTPRAETTPELPLAGVRILVAEDGPDNQRLIQLLLRKAGADVTIVENGALAVAAVLQVSLLGALEEMESGTADGLFDVVLMDMQMPVMDGYEAANTIKQACPQLPIIALTAHAMKGEREKCVAAGCDEYLTKPIDRIRLIETTKRFATCQLTQHSKPVAEPAAPNNA